MNMRAGAVTREEPPFRAEHIGSLLRPRTLLQKRERFARGEISQADLTDAEDAAIVDAAALQERLGLQFATDGEFRRRSYHSFFYRQLGELSIDTVAGADAEGGAADAERGQQPVALIKSRVRWTHPVNVADFNFLRSKTKLLPKITIPGPCALHFRVAMPRCWRTPIVTLTNSGMTSSTHSIKSWLRWRTGLSLRADR